VPATGATSGWYSEPSAWYWQLLILVGVLVGFVITAMEAWGRVVGRVRRLVRLARWILALAYAISLVAVLVGAAANSSRPLVWPSACLLVGGVPLYALGAGAALRERPSAKGSLGLLLIVAALACVAADLVTQGRTVEISWWVPLIALAAFGSTYVLLALFGGGRTGARVAQGLVGLGLIVPVLGVAFALGVFDRLRR
jgi:hypothetical protein